MCVCISTHNLDFLLFGKSRCRILFSYTPVERWLHQWPEKEKSVSLLLKTETHLLFIWLWAKVFLILFWKRSAMVALLSFILPVCTRWLRLKVGEIKYGTKAKYCRKVFHLQLNLDSLCVCANSNTKYVHKYTASKLRWKMSNPCNQNRTMNTHRVYFWRSYRVSIKILIQVRWDYQEAFIVLYIEREYTHVAIRWHFLSQLSLSVYAIFSSCFMAWKWNWRVERENRVAQILKIFKEKNFTKFIVFVGCFFVVFNRKLCDFKHLECRWKFFIFVLQCCKQRRLGDRVKLCMCV